MTDLQLCKSGGSTQKTLWQLCQLVVFKIPGEFRDETGVREYTLSFEIYMPPPPPLYNVSMFLYTCPFHAAGTYACLTITATIDFVLTSYRLLCFQAAMTTTGACSGNEARST